MLKTTQSLNVNNSSNQTGVAHQTSQEKESTFKTKKEVLDLAKELVGLAAKLQNGIWKLQETSLVQEMFSSDIAEAEMEMSTISLALSDVFGTAYMEAIREKGGEL